MADDIAPARVPSPPPSPSAPYAIKRDYSISQRIALLEAYRNWVAQSASKRSISAQALSDIIDDVFMTFSDWLAVEDPLFKSVYKDALDPNTVRNFLKCELGLNVRKMHVKSFRTIDAFLQIVRDHPPTYL